MNKVTLIGHVGTVPTTRGSVTSFTLATSYPKKVDGQTQKDERGFTVMNTEWHRITCFNGLAKLVAAHVSTGKLVALDGRIHYSRYTDQDGTERHACEIIADDIEFLSRGPAQSEA